MSLLDQVKTNLISYNGWLDVETVDKYLVGHPPELTERQWVVPRAMDPDIGLDEMDSWFGDVARVSGSRPPKVVVGLVNDDSTVVYYDVHDGIIKPRQN